MFFYLATVHCQSCTLNVNKIDVIQCFRKLICAFSLTCFRVRICKISDKSDTFSLNYSNLFRGPLFFGTQCIYPRDRSRRRHLQLTTSTHRNTIFWARTRVSLGGFITHYTYTIVVQNWFSVTPDKLTHHDRNAKQLAAEQYMGNRRREYYILQWMKRRLAKWLWQMTYRTRLFTHQSSKSLQHAVGRSTVNETHETSSRKKNIWELDRPPTVMRDHCVVVVIIFIISASQHAKPRAAAHSAKSKNIS